MYLFLSLYVTGHKIGASIIVYCIVLKHNSYSCRSHWAKELSAANVKTECEKDLFFVFYVFSSCSSVWIVVQLLSLSGALFDLGISACLAFFGNSPDFRLLLLPALNIPQQLIWCKWKFNVTRCWVAEVLNVVPSTYYVVGSFASKLILSASNAVFKLSNNCWKKW